MATAYPEVEVCPYHGIDQRKSSAGGGGLLKSAIPVEGFRPARDVLRDPKARQAGFKAELVARYGSATRPPILFLSGEPHRRQRAATARFFAPRTVNERPRPVMEAASERLIAHSFALAAAIWTAWHLTWR